MTTTTPYMSPSILPMSAFSSSRYREKTSDKFQAIGTAQAVGHLQREGWQVFKATEAKTRFPDRRPFVKHQIQLTHPAIAPVNGLQPLVYLQNANDGTSSFSLFAGLFRFICSNGLVVGSSFISAKVRHIGDMQTIRQELHGGAFKVSSQFPNIMEKVELMTQRNITEEERVAFSALAFHLRYPNRIPAIHTGLSVGHTLRRSGDAGEDLWTHYNRTQEDLITGGFSLGRRSARGLRSLTRSTVINRQLWNLAEKTLEGGIVEEWEKAKQLSYLQSHRVSGESLLLN